MRNPDETEEYERQVVSKEIEGLSLSCEGRCRLLYVCQFAQSWAAKQPHPLISSLCQLVVCITQLYKCLGSYTFTMMCPSLLSTLGISRETFYGFYGVQNVYMKQLSDGA